MCKVSIIIPCYNVDEILIERCLKSIDSQAFSDYEVIIVNDGSKPEYRKIFDNLEEKHKNISIFHQENQGVSAARNFGLKKSHGEYVLYVDADDYLAPSYLNEAVKVAESENADIVMGMNITTYTRDYSESTPEGSGKVVRYEGNEIKQIFKWMLGRIQHQGGSSYLGQGPWNRLVRIELAKKIQFNESLAVGEDIVWNLQLLGCASKLCVVSSNWYIYYMNPKSSSRKFRENAIKESYDSLIEMKKYLDLEDDEQYLSFCMRCWSDLKRIYRCYLAYGNKNVSKEKRHLFKDEPWCVLANKKFKRISGFKLRFMRVLYMSKLLFSYYRIKDRLSFFSNNQR